MEEFDVLQDIASRTGGDIYIGVVGPVRTGKSTFVKRFLELLVIPRIEDEFERQRTWDELPQSGAGRTVMTSEPKFIPAEGVEISLNGGLRCRVRLVDSVGYPVEGALGYTEGDFPRLVLTPWFDHPIPFQEAAEVGTRKVIADHSTIGMVVTADGSFGEIPRERFVEPERRVIGELKELGKPFLVLLNTARPHDPNVRHLSSALEEEYGVTVIPANLLTLDREGFIGILEQVLYEFPVRRVDFLVPDWVEELEPTHWLRDHLHRAISGVETGISRVRDVEAAARRLGEAEHVAEARVLGLNLGAGTGEVQVAVPEETYNRCLRELAGEDLSERRKVVRFVREAARIKKSYLPLEAALAGARETGYGMVLPSQEDMIFEEPELVRKGNQFGVRLRARAPSLHILRAEVRAEYTPVLGTEKQSEELIRYLVEKFEDNPRRIWESNILGKSLAELLEETVRGKLERLSPQTQQKLHGAMEKIVNEGSGIVLVLF